ncbi:MAG TPA: C45 family peptidase [Anaerolineae bacterium]|nr:C45 family peptidase [Anaerolineae bacterium]
MATDQIPVIEVRGTHREVGQQIGENMKSRLQRMLPQFPEGLPDGVTWDDMLQQGRLYLDRSRAAYPQFIEELEGLAIGAELPFEELFVGMCEELWEAAAWRGTSPVPAKGCTDLVARGRATADGSTLVAHTNDLSPNVEEDLVILKVKAGDEPEFLGVSVGGAGYSAGFNAAGISMTGNQVSCNDIRPGVPRLLLVRAILAARRLEEAMDACLHPQRASNYNNVIADAHGEAYSMEGSATDCEPIYIRDDILAHANHFVSLPMRAFEADRNDIGGSVIRHNRAWRLLRENYGHLSVERFQTLLADHANYPGSICKHGIESVTVFSIIINLNDLQAWIGRGRPCQTTWHEHRLTPWSRPGDWPLT